MLEFIRRQATSVFSWVILGVLGLVFGLSFGLPSDSLSLGSQPLVKVHGETVGDDDYRYQFNLMSRIVPIPKDTRMQELMGLKEEVLDAIIERHVLAETARNIGLGATEWDAETLVLNGHLIVLGDTMNWIAPEDLFNYELFVNGFLRGLQITEPGYLEVQANEILARTVRDLLVSSTTIPESEVRAEYDKDANKLSLRYVRFEMAGYADLVDLPPAEVQAHVDVNRDTLKKSFESQGMRFTKLPKQVRLRVIELAKDAESATATMAAARKRIRSGEDFRSVAREVSEHESSRRGGDYGWVNVEGTGTGLDPVIDQALEGLEPGQVSTVLEGESGLYLVQIHGTRQGDVPEADALVELGEEALAAERGRDLAKQAAEEALLAVKGGKTLSELVESPSALPTPGTPIENLDQTAATPPTKPTLQTTGLFPRDKPIPGLGAVPELAGQAWDASDKAEVLGQVFETPTAFVIAGVDRKEVASDEGFQAARATLYPRLAELKARKITSFFAKRRCLEAKGRGDIVPSTERIARLMVYDTKIGVDDEGNRTMRPYSVCDRVGMRGGMLRTGLAAQQGGGTAE